MTDPDTSIAVEPAQAGKSFSRKEMTALVMGALGIVYGDLGTSPLYAVRECFNPEHGVALNQGNVFGILSLIFWSLTLVVIVKYLFVVMYADNDGEGGIMALMAQVLSGKRNGAKGTLSRNLVIGLGLTGTALLVADGMITPSISVLSAIEGVEVATPGLTPAVVPITIAVLVGLFVVQRHGTGPIGIVFGPIMLLWFAMIAIMGLRWIIQEPGVLLALDPRYAVRFFLVNRLHGLIVLGAVVLCVTGCEALYADMGHFGRRPIALALYFVVFPSVLLNYFGQGALLLVRGPTPNPFFGLVPAAWLYPVVSVATVATVIASQALISGMFSLALQTMRLNYCPRLTVVHTSERIHGQIYVRTINTLLMVACVALVLGFRHSSELAAAYGIAVVGTMATTSILMYAVEREQWGWRRWQALSVTGAFLALDTFFLVGNVTKIFHGGWVPLAVSGGVLIVLTTWKRGNDALNSQILAAAIPLNEFIPLLVSDRLPRVKGTALFLMTHPDITPRSLLHHIKHNRVLHEQVILLAVITEGIPVVPYARRVTVQDLGHGFAKLVVRRGFKQELDMPETLVQAEAAGLHVTSDISYFIGHTTIRPTGRTRMRLWRKQLFALLSDIEAPPTALHGVPANRVVELGEQAEI